MPTSGRARPEDQQMNAATTGLVLIGLQNEYFSSTGLLRGVVEDATPLKAVLSNIVRLLEHLATTSTTMIATPIIFTAGYSELIDPVGVLAQIKSLGAFQAGTHGSQTVLEVRQFGLRIVEVRGRRGLNAFSDTALDEVLTRRGIKHLVLAGALGSVCIDSTGRSAVELGYRVTVLSDCIVSRTTSEHDLFCRKIFPLYAGVMTSSELLHELVGLNEEDHATA